jgi:glycosyltransferase involved in cell wall biosynthesis
VVGLVKKSRGKGKVISILLATYNGERYIKKSIDSIMDQTFKDWKLLIGFNGTTDSSKEIVESYNDKRIFVYDYLDEKGKAKTLNKLLEKVNTPWCAIQDDDDVWHSQKLGKQISITKDFDVIGTRILYIDEKDNVIGAPDLAIDNFEIKIKSMNGVNQVANSSAIFKTEWARKVNGWNEDVDGIEDFDFWLKIMRHEESKFCNIPEFLCLHRLHEKSNFNTKEQDINKIL